MNISKASSLGDGSGGEYWDLAIIQQEVVVLPSSTLRTIETTDV